MFLCSRFLCIQTNRFWAWGGQVYFWTRLCVCVCVCGLAPYLQVHLVTIVSMRITVAAFIAWIPHRPRSIGCRCPPTAPPSCSFGRSPPFPRCYLLLTRCREPHAKYLLPVSIFVLMPRAKCKLFVSTKHFCSDASIQMQRFLLMVCRSVKCFEPNVHL